MSIVPLLIPRAQKIQVRLPRWPLTLALGNFVWLDKISIGIFIVDNFGCRINCLFYRIKDGCTRCWFGSFVGCDCVIDAESSCDSWFIWSDSLICLFLNSLLGIVPSSGDALELISPLGSSSVKSSFLPRITLVQTHKIWSSLSRTWGSLNVRIIESAKPIVFFWMEETLSTLSNQMSTGQRSIFSWTGIDAVWSSWEVCLDMWRSCWLASCSCSLGR